MVSRPDLQVEFVNVNRTEEESIIFEEGPSAIYTHVEMEGLHNDVNEYLIHSLPKDSYVISTNYNKRQVLSRLRATHDFSHFDILLTSMTQPLSRTCHPKICQQT